MKLITKQPGYFSNKVGDDLISCALFHFKSINEIFYSSSSSISYLSFVDLVSSAHIFYLDKFHDISNLFSSECFSEYLTDLKTLACHDYDLDPSISYDSTIDNQSVIDITIGV